MFYKNDIICCDVYGSLPNIFVCARMGDDLSDAVLISNLNPYVTNL